MNRIVWPFVACACCLPAAAQDAPLTEDVCAFITQRKGEDPKIREVPGLQILGRRADDPLRVKGIDVAINAVVCWRSEARFAENDYLVSEAGLPFYVKTDFDDEAKNRTVVLDRVNESYRIRLVEGPALSDAERLEHARLLGIFEAKPHNDPAPEGPHVGLLTQLAPQAPADAPHPISADRARAYEEAIAPYVEQARQSYPEAKQRFLSGLPKGHTFFVTTRLKDSEGRFEQVFRRRQRGREISGYVPTPIAHGPHDPSRDSRGCRGHRGCHSGRVFACAALEPHGAAHCPCTAKSRRHCHVSRRVQCAELTAELISTNAPSGFILLQPVRPELP